jgi:perosamine synthetase
MYSHRFQKQKVAENIGWRGINLPSFPDLETQDIREICQVLSSFKIVKAGK